MSPRLSEFRSGNSMYQIKILQNCNLACCFEWVLNLVADIEGVT